MWIPNVTSRTRIARSQGLVPFLFFFRSSFSLPFLTSLSLSSLIYILSPLFLSFPTAKHFLVPYSKSSSEELVRKYLTHTDPQYFDDFLRDVLPKDAAEILAPRGPKDTFGSPIVLVMSSAAIRSSNLYSNCLRGGLQARGTEMTKLFAKHFTLEEHMKILSRTVTRIAFATPNRVLKLLDTPSSFFNSTSSSSSSSSSPPSVSALDLDSCKYLVIDLFLNKQEKTTFEVSEVAKDLWDLYKKHLHQRVVEGKMKIIFY
jgi:hypothetical protein